MYVRVDDRVRYTFSKYSLPITHVSTFLTYISIRKCGLTDYKEVISQVAGMIQAKKLTATASLLLDWPPRSLMASHFLFAVSVALSTSMSGPSSISLAFSKPLVA